MENTLPAHLTVYLSGSCNLACRYCYARGAGEGAPAEKKLLRGLDYFLERAPEGARVTFLGGEPLLQGRLLKLAILRVRRAGPAMPVRVFTNGTLLDRDWLSFFARYGVRLLLSLDGGKKENDANRRFRSGGGSVFSAVLERLPPASRAGVTANLVVTPGTAGRLRAALRRLRLLGFESIAWAPDLIAVWRKRDAAELARSARQAGLDYFRLLAKGRPPYEIANIYEALAEAAGEPAAWACGSLALGPDGMFYPCDKLVGAPPAVSGLYASAPRGKMPDLSGRRRFFREAARAGARPSPYCCGVGSWAVSGLRGGKGRSGGAGYEAGQAALRALVSGWLASMARRGLKSPAFRRLHGAG